MQGNLFSLITMESFNKGGKNLNITVQFCWFRRQSLPHLLQPQQLSKVVVVFQLLQPHFQILFLKS